MSHLNLYVSIYRCPYFMWSGSRVMLVMSRIPVAPLDSRRLWVPFFGKWAGPSLLSCQCWAWWAYISFKSISIESFFTLITFLIDLCLLISNYAWNPMCYEVQFVCVCVCVCVVRVLLCTYSALQSFKKNSPLISIIRILDLYLWRPLL